MKNFKKKVLLILATCLVEDHDITSIGVSSAEKEYIDDLFDETPRISNSIGSLMKHYLTFNKRNLHEEAKKNPEMTYDRMLVTFKPKTYPVLDNTPANYTYKTLRSVVNNYLEYFDDLLSKGGIPISKNIAVCIVPVLVNRELYDLSQKIMYDYQNRDDKTQDYYKFTEFFNANRKSYFYTVYLTQNHVL